MQLHNAKAPTSQMSAKADKIDVAAGSRRYCLFSAVRQRLRLQDKL
jgi:hypothetical protein